MGKGLRDSLSGELRVEIDEIWRKAKTYQEKIIGDNIQGYSHSSRVERNIEKIVSNKTAHLSELSIFLLSASACVHDIGKVVSDQQKKWSIDHGKRSMEIILREYCKIGLEKAQAIAVAHIVSVHNDGCLDELQQDAFPIDSEEVNLVELAAVFRLGDMLDTCCQRTPEIVSDITYPSGNLPQKWLARQSIIGWKLDSRNRIVFHAAPKNNEEVDAVYSSKDMMIEELAKISPKLRLGGYPCEIADLEIDEAYLSHQIEERSSVNSPFPGIGFYTQKDAKIFRGREKEIEEEVGILSNNRISLLIGESGSGKTSLIYAGIFPKLEGRGWKCIYARPFDKPQENIKSAIWKSLFKGTVPVEKSLLDILKRAADSCKTSKLLIAIDQFEDILDCSDQKILDDFCLDLAAVEARVIPNLRILIAFREEAAVKLNKRLLKRVTGSARQLPSVDLETLDEYGAKNALEAGLENAGIGVDQKLEKGQKPLINIILNDLLMGSDRIYPPFMQIVAESLCKEASENSPPIITRDIYAKLGGTKSMIANYLTDKLKEFGNEADEAKRILVALAAIDLKKSRKSISQLATEAKMSADHARRLLTEMIDCRLVRSLEKDEFELIHDFLSKIVYERFVSQDDRVFKSVQNQFDAMQQAYTIDRSLITSPLLMANVYRNRKILKTTKNSYGLIVGSSLLGKSGSCWYFVRNLTGRKIRTLIWEQIDHPLPEVRREAAIILTELSLPLNYHRNKQFVVRMLHEGDGWVRYAVASVLAKLVSSEEREIVEQLLSVSDPFVQKLGICLLINEIKDIDRKRIVELLIHRERSVRWAAVLSLAKIVKPIDEDALIQTLSSNDPQLRRSGLNKLKNIAGTSEKELVVELLSDPRMNIQKACITALKQVVLNKEVVEKLLANFDVKEEKYTKASIENVTNSADSPEKQAILEALNNQNWSIRRRAIQELSKNAQTEDSILLIRMLDDPDPDVRATAKIALKQIALPQGNIILLLKDPNPRVRKDADKLLKQITKNIGGKLLNELVNGRNFEIVSCVVTALSKIARIKDIENIIERLSDSDFAVQKAAADAIETIALYQDLGLFSKLLKYRDWFVRKTAVRALIKIAQPQDREIIFRMLLDPDADVQLEAKIGLKNTFRLEDRAYLAKMLEASDPEVREAAIKFNQFIDNRQTLNYPDSAPKPTGGFREFAIPKMQEDILKLLSSSDIDVRENIINFLSQYHDPSMNGFLNDLLNHHNDYVRKAAVSIIAQITQTPDERDAVLDKLAEKSYGWKIDNELSLESLSKLDQAWYSPTRRTVDDPKRAVVCLVK
jgi:HEAT repeat protein